jgi:hypothetical protein
MQQDEFHLILPIIHLPESTEPKIGQQAARISFHDTDNGVASDY